MEHRRRPPRPLLSVMRDLKPIKPMRVSLRLPLSILADQTKVLDFPNNE